MTGLKLLRVGDRTRMVEASDRTQTTEVGDRTLTVDASYRTQTSEVGDRTRKVDASDRTQTVDQWMGIHIDLTAYVVADSVS